MFIRSSFHHRQFTLARLGVVCALLLILALAAFKASAPHSFTAGAATRQQLSFEDRVAAQRAIEEVYYRHRIWPTDNPQPKPPLDEMMPDEAIRAKVEDYLRKSSALEAYWRRAITPDELQAELERMARDTRQPDALAELWAALSHDPMMIAECLSRPTLVERALREGYANDERFHGELRRRAEAELRQHAEPDAPARMRAMSGEYREVEWRQSIERAPELALSSYGDTVHVKYSPRIENDQLQQDELAILYILMTAKDGRLLDQDITSPGGQGIAYRQNPGPRHTIFFTTVTEKKGGKFIGYLFFITERSFREILSDEGSIALPLKPPSSDFNLKRLGVNAKVSVAIAVENPKKKGNRFIRFATGISTAELTATAQ